MTILTCMWCPMHFSWSRIWETADPVVQWESCLNLASSRRHCSGLLCIVSLPLLPWLWEDLPSGTLDHTNWVVRLVWGGYFSYLFSSLAPRSQFSLCDKIMSNSVRFSTMTFSGVSGVASSRTGPSRILLTFLKACPTISTSFACSSFHLHIWTWMMMNLLEN